MKVNGFILAVIVGVAMSVSVSAQLQLNEKLESAPQIAGAPATIGELVSRMRSQVRESVISIDWATDSFIIPVAGNTPGSGGTYFKSDVVFNNDRLTDQRIAVGWFAAGQNNCASALQYFTLPANTVTVADDFVNVNLGKTGVGAVLVVGVTANGLLDDDAEIDGYSRIWTPQPGSAGTVSQNFSAIDVQDSIGSLEATLMGLKQNSQFRTNVGIVNMDNEASHSWTFTSLVNGRTTTFSVPPCSMVQTGATANSGAASGNVAFSVKSDGFGFYWSGFGSSTDNVTGDGWVSRAIQ